MLRNALRSKIVLTLAIALAASGLATAGEGCRHGDTAKGGDEVGSHCLMAKGVVKKAEMTDDGAVVVFKGKNEKAVEHIKAHLTKHSKGEGCEGCVLSRDEVSTSVEINEAGGTLTVQAKDPEAVKAVQEWAKAPAGGCCAKGAHAKKA